MGVQISAPIYEKSSSSAAPPVLQPEDASSLVASAPAQSASTVVFSDDFLLQRPAAGPAAPMNVPVTMSVPRAASSSSVPYYRMGMRRGRPCGWFFRNQTGLLIGAGVLVFGGAVVWMMAKSTRGFKRAPGVAGLHRTRRRGRRRR